MARREGWMRLVRGSVLVGLIAATNWGASPALAGQSGAALDGEWESDGGIAITWDDDWTVDDPMTGTEELQGFGDFTMLTFSPEDLADCTTYYCGLSIVVYDAASADPEDVETAFVETSLNASGTEVLLDGEEEGDDDDPTIFWSLIARGSGEGAYATVSWSASIDDETFTMTLTADPESLPDYLDLAQDTIELNGDDLFDEIDVDDIEDALDDR